LEVEADEGSNMIDIIRKVDQPVDGVLVFLGSRPVPLDTPIVEIGEAELRIVSVASGG
jgi:sulfur carrier protein ThiS